MKTRKTITLLLILTLLLIAGKSSGVERFKGDTIRMIFENFMIEVISPDLIRNPLKHAGIEDNAAKISNWLEALSISEPGSDELIYIVISDVDEKDKLNYKNVTFENLKKTSKKMVFSDGKILVRDFGNYVIELIEPAVTTKYYLLNLQDLKKISDKTFSQQISNADILLPVGRKKINGWLTMNADGNFDSHFLDEASPLTSDMLILNAGVGAGIVKNQWVNDISFKIGLAFGEKGLQQNLYFAEFKMVYDFSNASGDNIFSVNSFVTAGWEHNFSKNSEKEKWFGLSLGYLVSRKTDFFEKNTWKFAINKRINQTISISPEFYFNGFFKNIYPGVQVGISF